MRAQLGLYLNRIEARFFLLLILGIIPLVFTACSGRKNGDSPIAESAPPPAADSDLGSPFDTGSGPVTDNLFDTTVNPNEKPQSGSGQVTVPTSPGLEACLVSGFSALESGESDYSGGYGMRGSHDTQSKQACLKPSDSGLRYPVTAESFYELGLELYEDIDSCLIAVLARAPRNEEEAPMIHRLGKMALVRCYRNIVREMASILPWGGPQMQSYRQQDDNLAVLLLLLSQQGQGF